VHFNGAIDITFFGTKVKDEHTILVVGISMEVESLISVQLKSIVILVAITLNAFSASKDVGIDVRVEVTKAT
jgi:hypothetical protein